MATRSSCAAVANRAVEAAPLRAMLGVLVLAAAAALLVGCVPPPGIRTPTALRPTAAATVAAAGARNQEALLPV